MRGPQFDIPSEFTCKSDGAHRFIIHVFRYAVCARRCQLFLCSVKKERCLQDYRWRAVLVRALSPLESQAVTDAEMQVDVKLCPQYAKTVNKQHVKIKLSVVAKTALKKKQRRRRMCFWS